MSLKFDRNSRVVSLSTNYEFTTNYQYDKLRLRKIQTNGAASLSFSNNTDYAEYDYYDDGKLKVLSIRKLTDGSLLHTEYEYNKINQLKSVTNLKGTKILSQFK